MEEDELNNLEPCELFVTTSGESMQFSIKICPEKINLQKIIEKCGGELHAKVGGPNTIRLLPLGDKPTQDEVFSSNFIYDCVRAQDLCDLNKYRINKTSLYTDDIDVMEILLGNSNWADCTRSGIKHSDVVSDFSDDDNGSSPTKNSFRGKLKGGRRDYTHTERSAIVKYIIETRRYSEVKGKQLWIDIEEANICPGRTWQSLREHYRKKIINNLHQYGLSDIQMKRLSHKYTEYHLRENSPCSSSSSIDETDFSPRKKDKSPRKGVRSLNIDKGNLDKSRMDSSKKKSRENYQEGKDKEFEENRIQDHINDSHKKNERKVDKTKCSPKKKVGNECTELSDSPQSSLIQNIKEMQELLNDTNSPVVNNTNSNTQVSQETSGNNSIFYSCQPGVINNEKSSSCEEVPNSNSESENENVPIDQLPNISTHEQVLSANHKTSNLNEIDSDAKTETFYSETEKDNGVKSPVKRSGSIRTPIKSIASNANTLHSVSEAVNNKSIVSPTKRRTNTAQTTEISMNDDTTQCHNLSNEIGYNAEESLQNEKQDLIPDSLSSIVKTQSLIYPNADGVSSSESEVEINRPSQKRHHRSGLTPKRSKIIRNSLSVKDREENAPEESTEIGENRTGKESKRRKKKNDKKHNAILSTTDESEDEDHVEEVELFKLLEKNTPLKKEMDDDDIDIDLVDDNNSIYEMQRVEANSKNTYNKTDSETDYLDDSEDDDILEDYEKKNSEDSEIVKYLPSSSSSNKEIKFQNYDNLNGRYDRTYYPKSGKRKKPKGESPNKRQKCAKVQHNIQGYYTVYEDMDILNYIKQHNAFQEVGGNHLWIKMEKSRVVPGRSWPSLKERFRKRILQQLDCYLEHGLEQDVFDHFFSYKEVKEESMENMDMEDKKSYKDKRYTHQDDVKILEYIKEKKAYEMVGGRKMWQDMVESDILYSRSWLSLKERYRRVIIKNLNVYKTHGFSETQLELFRSPEGGSDKSKKNRRWGSHTLYTHKEDQQILDFIVKCKGYSEVAGKTLWTTMSISEELKERTWLSLKERFRKKIIHNLNNFKLTEEEKQHLINKTSLKSQKISHRRIPKGPGYKTSQKKKQSDIRDIYRVKEAHPSTSGYRSPQKENKMIDSSDEFEEESESSQESSKTADEPKHKYSTRTNVVKKDELVQLISTNKTHDEKKIGCNIKHVERDLAALLSENQTPASPHSSILSNDLPDISEIVFEYEETSVENNNRQCDKSFVRANVEMADVKDDENFNDIENIIQFEQKKAKNGRSENNCSEKDFKDHGNCNQDTNESIRITKENYSLLNDTHNMDECDESNQTQELTEKNLSGEDENNKENNINVLGESKNIAISDSTTKVESNSENYSLRRSSRKSTSQLFYASPRKSINLKKSVDFTNENREKEIGNDNKDKDIDITTDKEYTDNNESELRDNEIKSDENPKNQKPSKKSDKQSPQNNNTPIKSVSPRRKNSVSPWRKSLSANETKSAKHTKSQIQSKNSGKLSPRKIETRSQSDSPLRKRSVREIKTQNKSVSPRRKSSVSPRRKTLSDNETKSANRKTLNGSPLRKTLSLKSINPEKLSPKIINRKFVDRNFIIHNKNRKKIVRKKSN